MRKKRIILTVIFLLLVLCGVIGISYAYWSFNATQKSVNVIGTDCLNIEMVEESEGIRLLETHPISNEEGMKLKPYTFTIKNTCNSLVDYSINLESMEVEERLDSHYIAVALDDNGINVLANFDKSTPIYKEDDYTGAESRVLLTGYLDGKESKTHTLRIWMDEASDEESMNKSFISKVVVSGTPNTVLATSPDVTTLNLMKNGEEIKDLASTNGFAYENQVTINCAGEKSQCYVKVSKDVSIVGSILKKCSTETPYLDCQDIETFSTFEPEVWYRTSRIITFKSKDGEKENPVIDYLSCVGDKCTDSTKVTLANIDKEGPSLEVVRITSGTNTAAIQLNANDLDSGLENVVIKYGETPEALTQTTIFKNEEYVLEHLTNNKTYYYEIVALDKVGNVTTLTGQLETKDIALPEVSTVYQDKEGNRLDNTTDSAYTGTVTLSFSDTIEHFVRITNSTGLTPISTVTCGSGYLPKDCSEDLNAETQDVWYKIEGNKTLTFDKENQQRVTIKALSYDGVNYSDVKEVTLPVIDQTAPSLTLNTAVTTSNSISIPLAMNDASGIRTMTCVYGTNTDYGSTATTINSGNCSLTNLKNNTTYYYQVTIEDAVGNQTVKTGSAKTGEISRPTISITGYNKSNGTIQAQNGYFYKETANVTFNTTHVSQPSRYIKSSVAGTSNVALVESCGTGSTPANCTSQSGTSMSANTWYKVNENAIITYGSALNSTGTIYAVLYDGVNFSTSGTSTLSKLDQTAPSVTIGNPTKTSYRATIPITTSDTESQIAGVTCKYGTTNGTYNANANSVTTSTCNLTGLNNNTTYYYQIIVTDKVGNQTTKTGSVTTGTMSTPTISLKGYNASNQVLTNAVNGYFYKEEATVTFNASGLTTQAYYIRTSSAATSNIDSYSCGTGSDPGNCSTSATKNLSANTWYKVNSNPTLTYQTNNNNTAAVYARIWDGANWTNQATGNISKIDREAPSVPSYTNSSNGNWARNVTITVSASDTGSGVDKLYNSWDSGKGWAEHKNDEGYQVDGTTKTGTIYYGVERSVTSIFKACDYVGNCSINNNATAIKIDASAPILTLGTVTSTETSITIPISARNSDISGEKSFTCTIGGKTCSCSGNTCSVNGLASNTSYSYSVVLTDNAGNTTTRSGSIKTDLLYNRIKIGDYVSYTPINTSYSIASTLTGFDSDQTIKPNELTLWRVIRKNSDGTLDLVSEYTSSNEVFFSGMTGYKKYVGTLNTIASQYETSGVTSGSRYMGYNGQTESVTSTKIGQTLRPPWTENTTASNSPKGSSREREGGGDELYTTDINLVRAACGNNLWAYKVNLNHIRDHYWLSSRLFQFQHDFYWEFFGRIVNSNGRATYEVPIFVVRNENVYSLDNVGALLRPIVILKSGISAISGDGTESNPWKVN